MERGALALACLGAVIASGATLSPAADGTWALRSRGAAVRFEPNGVAIALGGRLVRWAPEGMRRCGATASGEAHGRLNLYLGNAPSQWREGAAAASRVEYACAVPGWTVELWPVREGIEYRLRLAPGAVKRSLAFRYDGVDAVELEGPGLRIRAAGGTLTESGLRANQAGRPVSARYARPERAGDGTWRVRIELGELDAALPLEVDPAIEWGSFLGGSGDDSVAALVERMRGSGGVPILDRRHFLRVYPRCFIGREAIDWLTREERLTRDEAVTLSRRLVERGLVRHVLDEHDFEDTALFYRFAADETPASRRAASGI